MSDTTTNNASTTNVNNEVAQNNEEVSLPTLSPSLFFFFEFTNLHHFGRFKNLPKFFSSKKPSVNSKNPRPIENVKKTGST